MFKKCILCKNIFLYADRCPKCGSSDIAEIELGDKDTPVKVTIKTNH